MALLFVDGYDAGDCNAKGYVGTWQASNSVSPNTRFGVGRWAGVTNTTVSKTLTTPINKIYTGVALASNMVDSGSRPRILISGDGGATVHLGVGLNNNSVVLFRGNFATYLTGASGVFAANVFYYIEISATIHDTTGTCEVRVNGSSVINFTGDTRNGGGSTIDTVSFLSYSGAYYTYVDDFYICDDSGAAPYNTFLGDIRIHTLSPSGAGSLTQMTPSSGANYTTVDELPYSGTDYVRGSAGQVDLYTASDLPAGVGTIYGVQANAIVKKTDAGLLSGRTKLKSGTTTVNGATTVLGTVDYTVTDTRQLNPDTSLAWTAGDVNALEVGMEAV